MRDESNGTGGGVSRRDVLGGAAAALVVAAVSGTPVRLLASTDDWRVDLTPPRVAGNGSMLGVPFEKHAVVRIAIVGTGLRGSSVLGELLAIEGAVPAPFALPAGCRFHPRCVFMASACTEQDPPLLPLGPEHSAACIRAPVELAA